MKIAGTISRYLLGLIFVVFGANGFLHFIPLPPPTGAVAQQYMGALFVSHFLAVAFVLEVIAGLLLLVGRYVPLALVLIGPVVIHILLYHALLDPAGLPLAVVTVVLWLLVFANVRSAFAGIFEAK